MKDPIALAATLADRWSGCVTIRVVPNGQVFQSISGDNFSHRWMGSFAACLKPEGQPVVIVEAFSDTAENLVAQLERLIPPAIDINTEKFTREEAKARVAEAANCAGSTVETRDITIDPKDH